MNDSLEAHFSIAVTRRDFNLNFKMSKSGSKGTNVHLKTRRKKSTFEGTNLICFKVVFDQIIEMLRLTVIAGD